MSRSVWVSSRERENDKQNLPISQIRECRPDLQNRRLRLIHSGRLLSEETLLYASVISLEERQKRTNIDEDMTGHISKTATTWIHCSVGQPLEPGEADTEDSNTQVN
jgi:DUF2407 ubiquitin-like domain